MDKFCVFCGSKPKRKSKEHVVPQWLIELTGNPKRAATFGVGMASCRLRSFAFDQLQFPACGKCNSFFSHLETQGKAAVERLLARAPINAALMDALLTWLDKVRVGLWCGYQYFDSDFVEIHRNYHVVERISASDRSVLVQYAEGVYDGLGFAGPGTLLFLLNPMVFGIRINHVFLTNLSGNFVNAPNLGLPYIDFTHINVTAKHFEGDLRPGSGSVKLPVNRLSSVPNGHVFHQCILNGAGAEIMPQEEGRRHPRIAHPELGKSLVFYEAPAEARWIDDQEDVPLGSIEPVWWEQLRRTWGMRVLHYESEEAHRVLADPAVRDRDAVSGLYISAITQIEAIEKLTSGSS